jgi:nucleotide-binding universal stress UspA family protein
VKDYSRSLLIGFDGSPEAEAAIRAAGAILGPGRAVVAHVADIIAAAVSHTGPMRGAAEELEAEEARGAARTAERGAELAEHAGFEAVAVVARGTPKAWPKLLELADEHGAEAVVVGARGIGRVESALLGSVSAGLLGHSHLPVLIVPPLPEEHPSGPVLIAYDGSVHADAAIEAAGRLLAEHEAVLQTVWVSCRAVAAAGVAGAPAGVVAKGAAEIDRGLRAEAERSVERGVRLAADHGLELRGEAVEARGNVWRTLLDSAEAGRAAAVVVGSHGRSALGAMLTGSVSRALVHYAPAPVLVVRPRAHATRS